MINYTHEYMKEFAVKKGTQIHDFLKDYVEKNSTYFYIEETEAYTLVFAKADIKFYNVILQQCKYSCGPSEIVYGISIIKTHYTDVARFIADAKPLLRNFSNIKLHDIVNIHNFLEEIKAMLQSYNEEMKDYEKAELIEQMKNI